MERKSGSVLSCVPGRMAVLVSRASTAISCVGLLLMLAETKGGKSSSNPVFMLYRPMSSKTHLLAEVGEAME